MATAAAFAVEDTAAQVVWSALGPGPVDVRVEPTGFEVTVDADGGPGSLALDGLPPATAITVRLRPAGAAELLVRLRTLAPPPGRECFRLATVSDLHLGARGFGHRGGIVEADGSDGAEPPPLRCARAAVAEALAWGAQRLVVKGDLTHSGQQEEWDAGADLLASVPVPVDVIPGNHDTSAWRTVEPADAAARRGLSLVDGVRAFDLPGVRLVLADTTVPGRSHGRVDAVAGAIADAVAGAERGALVALHHHLERLSHSSVWPPGIGPAGSRTLLRRLAATDTPALVTAGHTHRHRARRHGRTTVTQVGSTSDYPGVWAGYVVHEGGIRQVVRRVGAPACLRWTELTRRGVGGLWQFVAPGKLEDRCLVVDWAS